jgi:hypothetical protein
MTGVLTLSMEIELGWGVHDLDETAHLSADGEAERVSLDRLLGHCDDVEVPITFNVVGHLLEERCDGVHDGPHEEGWFDNDPGSDSVTDPLFYAPEVPRKIQTRSTDHELCTHTYSHVPANEASTETITWELETAQGQLAEATGQRPVSFVPPRHSPPAANVLRETGIEIVRMGIDTSGDGRLARLHELVVGPHPQLEPTIADGIVETACTTYPSLTAATLPSGQRQPLTPFRTMPVRLRQRLQRQYLRRTIEQTVETDGVCHLWCHLYDLSNEYQWPVVQSFLSEVAAWRDRGDVAVLTMAELNDHLRTERVRSEAGAVPSSAPTDD